MWRGSVPRGSRGHRAAASHGRVRARGRRSELVTGCRGWSVATYRAILEADGSAMPAGSDHGSRSVGAPAPGGATVRGQRPSPSPPAGFAPDARAAACLLDGSRRRAERASGAFIPDPDPGQQDAEDQRETRMSVPSDAGTAAAGATAGWDPTTPSYGARAYESRARGLRPLDREVVDPHPFERTGSPIAEPPPAAFPRGPRQSAGPAEPPDQVGTRPGGEADRPAPQRPEDPQVVGGRAAAAGRPVDEHSDARLLDLVSPRPRPPGVAARQELLDGRRGISGGRAPGRRPIEAVPQAPVGPATSTSARTVRGHRTAAGATLALNELLTASASVPRGVAMRVRPVSLEPRGRRGRMERPAALVASVRTWDPCARESRRYRSPAEEVDASP
jgi:hypothetical protein